MDRDPTNYECTRDPIFLLQSCERQWTQMPDGLESDGESWLVSGAKDLDEWIKPFIEWDEDDPTCGHLADSEEFYEAASGVENDHGWPMIYVVWRTESVFLTRPEAEAFGRATNHRYAKWRVYCIPCDGELATILREFEPVENAALTT